MTFPPNRRPLLDVIAEHPGGITPEELLSESHYTQESIDDFYAELGTIHDSVIQILPTDEDVLRWPAGATVLLRLKAGRA